MPAVDTRNANRDSLYIMGTMDIDGIEGLTRAKIRNLSARGAMAETTENVTCGMRLTLELGDIGKVLGVVAWVEGNRIGIAFDREIDPQLARPSHSIAPDPAGVVRRPSGALLRPLELSRLRAV